MRMDNKSQQSLISAMIAAMSTKTPTYHIKPNWTESDTDENDDADGTISITHHQSQARGK